MREKQDGLRLRSRNRCSGNQEGNHGLHPDPAQVNQGKGLLMNNGYPLLFDYNNC